MWIVHITDDRGRIHRCRMRGTIGWKSTYSSPPTAQVQKALKQAARTEWLVAGILLIAAVPILVLMIVPLSQRLPTWPAWSHWLILYAAIPVIWLLFDLIVLGPYIRPAYRRDHRRIALANGHCPACLYRIADLEPDHDGCIVCPECGGAWRPTRATP